MSNKKYRTPPKRVQDEPAEPLPDYERYREEIQKLKSRGNMTDDVYARATPDQVHEMVVEGWRAMRLLTNRFEGAMNAEPISEQDARIYASETIHFLRQVEQIAGGVVATIDVRSLRRIFAPDAEYPAAMRLHFEAAGIDPDYTVSETDPKPEPTPDPEPVGKPQSRPRGRRHPLMALLSLAMQASRLKERLLRRLWPHALNDPTHEEVAIQKAQQAESMMWAAT